MGKKREILMTEKLHSKHLILVMAIFTMLLQPACSLSSDQTIYEDLEHVDFNAEETAFPEAQNPIEEQVEAAALMTGSYFKQDGIKLYYSPH